MLRRDYGFRVGPGEINDAARVLHRIDLTDQRHVRDAWRTILSSSRDTAVAFDHAFDAFFFPGPPGSPQERQPPGAARGEPAGEGDGRGERQLAEGGPEAAEDAGDHARPECAL